MQHSHRAIRIEDHTNEKDTNIPALKTAVVAARAGEAGMGLGVTADEVRNLAQ